MTPRPHAGLGRVLDDLGATLLELVLGHPDRSRAIGGVVIHDPLDDAVLPPYALVLGVGLGEPATIAGLLHALGQQNAVGLVVRAPVPVSDELTAAVEHTGVALLGLTRGASWAQLAAMLRSLLAEDDIGGLGPETLGGMPSGDLFALSNAVAALLDAPVTIEDRGSRVLAFSGRQDEADPSRVETILGRQVPERYARVLAERGVFRVLYRTDQPVYVEPVTRSSLPRVAVAVRAGDEVLGSIWAAVREPLSADRTRALVDAARLVALHMLRIRAGADVERRLRTDLLSTALEGGPGARDALDRLGLAGRPVVVLAMATADPEGATATEAALTTERQRLGDALTMHLSALHPRCATALIGDITYGLVPSTHDGEQRVLTIASDFLDRVGDRTRAVIAVSPVAAGTSDLPTARATADRALRVLRAGGTRRTARLADVHVEALVLELRDLAAAQGDRPTGAIAKLIAYDTQHTARLVETLRAWLDAFGDVIAASAAVHVHPNTFRYRLRRLAEIGELDLTDPEARFAAMLQLRVLSSVPRENH
ncbi:helix-turn-helix domain-containing protein [Umezawaea sp. Da 62-37]|uniref:PucR family transcriptional regulator n=1 Tax=Umezawaea sp. Da 62-37 TaxID=3075927 RepID=UPI0028F7222F|nr:helix-turn-helix domain-containing protein [Umezawaea sp. Da 62-37]WNV88187.1 helix-turn-helix domain-containing protein [Umezawaea sp. Da 62-37]